MSLVKQWQNYKVGAPDEKPAHENYKCKVLDSVRHVTHIETALRIIKDKQLCPGLVFDESKLNTERILVNWLSPNHWRFGSRYGNIEFVCDFKKLIKGMNFYWVEAMTDYTPHACRILIAWRNYDGILDRYNPTLQDGPWYYDKDNDVHYWNSQYCLEFMFEGVIELKDFDRIEFTKHHEIFCNLYNFCEQRGWGEDEAGSKFIATLIGQNIKISYYKHFNDVKLKEQDGKIRRCYFASTELKKAIYKIMERVFEQKFGIGIITSEDAQANMLVKACLNFYATNDEEFRKMLLMFKSGTEFKNTFLRVVKNTFKLTDILDN